MLREVVVVTMGALLAFVIRGLFFAAFHNTLLWYIQLRAICHRCGKANSTYVKKVDGDDHPLCYSCAQQEYGNSVSAAVWNGQIRYRRKLDKDGGF